MFLRRVSATLGICMIFCIGITLAQGTSNKGTDFWVPFAGHIDGPNPQPPFLTLYITSEFNAVANITAGGMPLSPVNIIANQAQAVVIDPRIYNNVYVGTSEVIETNKGIHITSDKPIIVYSHIAHAARSAATLVFPTKVLGNDYYSVNYKQQPAGQYSQFTIVGVQDNTRIEIIPTQNSKTNAHLKDVPFTITLNKGDVYQFQSAADLSGSRIHTLDGCEPVSVFSGSTFTYYCESTSTVSPPPSTGDNLYQQLLPISAWGKNFVSAPFYNTLNGNTDIYRIIVANDNTTITVNNSTTNANGTALANPYAKGSIITFNSTGANMISADQPISVAQFQTTQGCNLKNPNQQNPSFPGDPEMTILNPIEQTLSNVTVYSALTSPPNTVLPKHFINIIIKTTDAPSLKIDGSGFPPSQFTPINSEYSYLVDDVSQSSMVNPTHRIVADGGFVAIAYGYGQVESYGYLAGSDLKNLNKYIEAKNAATNQAGSDGCAGTPYKFVLRLPYITNSLAWDFGNGTSYNSPVPPAYTTETINNTTVYKYEYDLNGGITYSAAGSYHIRVHALNPAPAGCDADEEIDLDFDVYNLPTSQFSSADEACINTSIPFKDLSDGQGRNITSWLWDFGDGATSTDQNPLHSYTATGSYTVKLTVTGETGCTSVLFSKAIRILALPVAEFTYPAVTCETKDILFTDQSSAADGTINSWLWDFGDSTTSSAQNPVHNFSKSGTYRVRLTILTDKGCGSSFSADIIVHPLPKADFEMPDFCLNDAIATFINNTTISDGSQLTYLWNFGDKNAGASRPNTSTQVNASHVYTEVGYYTVTLTVTSETGCDSFISKTFTVNGSTPKPDFSVQNTGVLCSNQMVMFRDNSSVDFGEITKIEWYYDFGNSAVAMETDNDPALRSAAPRIYSHSYPAFSSPVSKTITVKMIAYSGLSCSQEITRTIVLQAVPSVVFDSIPAICEEKSPVQLTQGREINNFPGSGIYSGPGVSASGLFDPRLAGPGLHTITYTFTGTNGCSESKSQTVTVYPAPTADAGKDVRILEGGQTKLSATASGSNLKYKWSPSTGLDHDDIPDPTASPTDDITYVLTVTSDQGCSAADAVFVKVLKSPEVPNTFTPNNDGINDAWNIKYLESYPGATVDVYNRYGAKIFSSVNYPAPWDGTMNGKSLPGGTYFYIINPRNGRKIVSGSVTIVR